jgi:hypothetical protein
MKSHGHAPTSANAADPIKNSRLQRLFTGLLTPFLNSARKRWLLLLGILIALVLSVAMALVQWVVLKMLPFDNKSEFPGSRRHARWHPAGRHRCHFARTWCATFWPNNRKCLTCRPMWALRRPITFNGLVRQYYLARRCRAGGFASQPGRQTPPQRKSHVIAQRLRPALEEDWATPPRPGQAWSKCRLVRPVMSPLVAEVYGPDEAGSPATGSRQVATAFATTADIVGVDTSLLEENAPRAFLRVRRQRAESLGIPVAAIAPRPCRLRRCPVPTRPTCTMVNSPNTRCRCAFSCRARARWAWRRFWPCPCVPPTGSWCPCPNWCKWNAVSSTNRCSPKICRA